MRATSSNHTFSRADPPGTTVLPDMSDMFVFTGRWDDAVAYYDAETYVQTRNVNLGKRKIHADLATMGGRATTTVKYVKDTGEIARRRGVLGIRLVLGANPPAPGVCQLQPQRVQPHRVKSRQAPVRQLLIATTAPAVAQATDASSDIEALATSSSNSFDTDSMATETTTGTGYNWLYVRIEGGPEADPSSRRVKRVVDTNTVKFGIAGNLARRHCSYGPDGGQMVRCMRFTTRAESLVVEERLIEEFGECVLGGHREYLSCQSAHARLQSIMRSSPGGEAGEGVVKEVPNTATGVADALFEHAFAKATTLFPGRAFEVPVCEALASQSQPRVAHSARPATFWAPGQTQPPQPRRNAVDALLQSISSITMSRDPVTGMYDASEMCQSAGSTWDKYLRNADSVRRIARVMAKHGLAREQVVHSRVGRNGGTWVHQEVAMHLAMKLNEDCTDEIISTVSDVMRGEWTDEKSMYIARKLAEDNGREAVETDTGTAIVPFMRAHCPNHATTTSTGAGTPACVDRAFQDALARAEGTGYDVRAKVSSTSPDTGGVDSSVQVQALAPADAMELSKHRVETVIAAKTEITKGAQAAYTQALREGLITPDAFLSAVTATTVRS